MAIAQGTPVSGSSASSTTCSATVTIPSANPYVIVAVCAKNNPARSTTGVTCGGVAMTRIGSEYSNIVNSDTTTSVVSFWELVAPASGSKSVVATFSGSSSTNNIGVVPYSGVLQASVTDGAVSEGSGVATGETGSITTTVNGTWAILMSACIDSGTAASTNATTVVADVGQAEIYDSSGLATGGYIRPIGAFSMSVTNNPGSVQGAWVMKGIKPVPWLIDVSDSASSLDTLSAETIGFSASDTASSTDSATQKYGWGKTQKSSATWTNIPKS